MPATSRVAAAEQRRPSFGRHATAAVLQRRPSANGRNSEIGGSTSNATRTAGSNAGSARRASLGKKAALQSAASTAVDKRATASPATTEVESPASPLEVSHLKKRKHEREQSRPVDGRQKHWVWESHCPSVIISNLLTVHCASLFCLIEAAEWRRARVAPPLAAATSTSVTDCSFGLGQRSAIECRRRLHSHISLQYRRRGRGSAG